MCVSVPPVSEFERSSNEASCSTLLVRRRHDEIDSGRRCGKDRLRSRVVAVDKDSRDEYPTEVSDVERVTYPFRVRVGRRP